MDRLIIFYKQFFAQNRAWLKLTIVWFIIAAVLGAVIFFIRPDLLTTIVSTYQDKFGASPALNFSLALQIFLQNLTASAIGLFGGIILGLGPLTVIGVNGFLLGFVVTSIFFLTGNVLTSLAFILGGILPHGIFELSAFLIACAIGLRLGLEWIQQKSAGKRWQVLKANLIQGLFVLPWVIILLFIAAIIEVFVSGKIVDKF